MDATQDQALALRFGVTGYPSLYMYSQSLSPAQPPAAHPVPLPLLSPGPLTGSIYCRRQGAQQGGSQVHPLAPEGVPCTHPPARFRECNLSSSPPRVKARRVPMREYLQSGFICERGMEGAGAIILDLLFAARPTVRPPPCSALRPKPRAPRCSRRASRRARLAAGGSRAQFSTSLWASRHSTRARAPTTVAPRTLPEAGLGATTVLHVVPSQKQNRGRAQRPL